LIRTRIGASIGGQIIPGQAVLFANMSNAVATLSEGRTVATRLRGAHAAGMSAAGAHAGYPSPTLHFKQFRWAAACDNDKLTTVNGLCVEDPDGVLHGRPAPNFTNFWPFLQRRLQHVDQRPESAGPPLSKSQQARITSRICLPLWTTLPAALYNCIPARISTFSPSITTRSSGIPRSASLHRFELPSHGL